MLSGMDLSPARQISITKGVHIQVSTITMAQGARLTSPIMEKLVAGAPVRNSMA